MKRSIGSLSLMALAVGAFAQANFTIVRPVDNSRVREKVKILFPKGSVPHGGYVGIFLNGQLIDAMVPEPSGDKKYLQYVLDTKGRGLPDTTSGKPDRLEAKLYVDYNGQPRIVRTSSVDLNIANVASIRIPNQGFSLRYHFTPGTELTYRLTQKVAVDTITESQNKMGGKPAELPLQSESFRMRYAVDNSYPNGDGLVRMQALPDPGKDYAIVTTMESETPQKFRNSQMEAVYMRLTSTGREVFGSIPAYWPLEGTSAMGDGTGVSLVAAHPLPTLPVKSVRPGDSWQTRFQMSKLDPEKGFHAQTSVVRSVGPARGEFVGVEWEMGHPCAKIHNTVQQGELSNADKKLLQSGSSFAGADKVKVDETVWFAMDTHQVIKTIRDITIETKSQGGVGGAFGAPGGGAPPSYGGGYSGGPGGYPGGAGAPGRGDEKWRSGDSQTLDQRRGPKGFTTPPMSTGSANTGSPTPPPGAGFPGGPGGRMGGGSLPTGEPTFVRIRFQQIFVLEG